jgi:hypothetical protein
MSAGPRSPPTVEERAKVSVVLPTALNRVAFVYLLMSWG